MADDLSVRVGGVIDGLKQAMAAASSAVEGACQTIQASLSKIQDKFDAVSEVGGKLAGIGATLTAGISLPLEEIGRHALEAVSDFQQTEAAFTTFLGSTQAALDKTQELYQFAATTPFQIPGIMHASRTLLAMQFAAKDIVPIMRVLGDTAAGLGIGQEGLERLVFHLGQVQSLGHLDGRVLRELGQMGINAGQMLANGLGVSVDEVHRRIQSDSLKSYQAINIMLHGMNELFGGSMEKMMATLAGQWSNFKDKITLTLKSIGDVLAPTARVILDFASRVAGAVQQMAEWFEKLPDPVKAGALALGAVAAALGPLAGLIGGAMLAIGPIAGVIGVSSVAFFGWGAVIVTATAALAGLAVWITKHWPGVRAALAQGFSGIDDLWRGSIGAATGGVIDILAWFAVGVKNHWNEIVGTFKMAFAIINTIVTGMRETLLYTFGLIIKISDAVGLKIPLISEGVKKLSGIGEAFAKADGPAQKLNELFAETNKSIQTLGLNAKDVNLTDNGKAWKDSHDQKLKDYTAAVHQLEDANKKGAASMETLAAARKKLDDAMKEKNPFSMPDMGDMGDMGGAPKETFKPVEYEKSGFVYDLQQQNLPRLIAAAQAKLDKFAATQLDSGALGKGASKLGDQFLQIADRAHKLGQVSKESGKVIAQAIKKPLDDLAEAYKSLGIESAESLKKASDDAVKAYNMIMQDGASTKDQQEAAWIAASEAAVKYADAIGQSVSMLDKLNLALAKVKQDSKNQGVFDILGKNAFSAFQTGFNSTLTNILNGTQKMKQAWSSLGVSMLQSVSSSLAQIATKWASTLMLMLSQKIAMNAAGVANDKLAASQSTTAHLEAAMKQIFANAKTAATAAWNAFASIPIIGPELGAAAAATTFAAVMSFGALGSAERGALLPDTQMLVRTHPKEMILPRALSEGMQNLIANGGSSNRSGGPVHYTQQNHYNGRPAMTKRDLQRSHEHSTKQFVKGIRNGSFRRFAGAV